MDELNCIFVFPSESELAANDSTSFNLRLNTFEDESDEFQSPCGSTTFIKCLDGSDFIFCLDGPSINNKTSVAQNITPSVTVRDCPKNCPVAEANQNPSYDSEIPLIHNISSSTSCRVPPAVTRSFTFKVKSPTYSTAQHSANESTFVYAFANIFSYTTTNCNSSQTAQMASDTLKVAPMNEADESLGPGVSPQTDANQSTLPPLLTPQCNGSQHMSMHGWSGALPNGS